MPHKYLLKNFPCIVENSSKPVKLPLGMPNLYLRGMLCFKGVTSEKAHIYFLHMAMEDRKTETKSQQVIKHYEPILEDKKIIHINTF
jgi:hypothetical protein